MPLLVSKERAVEIARAVKESASKIDWGDCFDLGPILSPCADLPSLAEANQRLRELLDRVRDAYKKHDTALTAYFAEYGAEHEGDDCPQDDTCECPLVVAMHETDSELRKVVQDIGDLQRDTQAALSQTGWA